MNKYVVWFRCAMLLGFVATNFFALPGIFWPAAVADLIGARPPDDPVWPAFGFLLSFLVSWFYIPAAVAPLSNRPTAWIAVVARLATAAFWYFGYAHFEPGPVPSLAVVDLGFGLAQFALLVMAVRTPSVPVS
jgi:hypothetical protein